MCRRSGKKGNVLYVLVSVVAVLPPTSATNNKNDKNKKEGAGSVWGEWVRIHMIKDGVCDLK